MYHADTIMPFGRYKGRKLKEVPLYYLAYIKTMAWFKALPANELMAYIERLPYLPTLIQSASKSKSKMTWDPKSPYAPRFKRKK